MNMCDVTNKKLAQVGLQTTLECRKTNPNSLAAAILSV